MDRGDTEGFSFAVPQFLNAEAFEHAIFLFERAGLPLPADLNAIHRQSQMAYAMCKAMLGQGYDWSAVEGGLGRFLSGFINYCLASRRSDWAAEWMKIVHFNGQPGVTARQALLRAYDWMPGVVRPF